MKAARESRFKVAHPHHVRVVFERADGCSPAIVAGELLDLSRGGAKLHMSQPVQFGEAVLLRIEDVKFDLRLSVSAAICWIRKFDDRWVLGCSFAPPLPEATIGGLLAKGILERRLAPRKETRVPLQARWECSASSTPRDVDLIDLSPGGFCLRSAMPAIVGSRMRLLARDGKQFQSEIGAKVRWQMDEANGFLIGCELSGVVSAAKLHEMVFGNGYASQTKSTARSWLGRVVDKLTEARRRPRACVEDLLGLNEHEKILGGANPHEPSRPAR